MTDRISKGDVESALRSLRRAAEQIGMDRRFDVEYGSRQNGIQHQLTEEQPGLSHPGRTSIGYSYASAHMYLVAMKHGLDSVQRDRQIRRATLRAPEPSFAGHSVYDPDARTNRRSGEDQAG